MLIFDESAVCTPVFCREVTGETPVLLPAAHVCAKLKAFYAF